MGINRIRLQAGSTEEMIKAQEAAAQDPELDRIRQQLFGEGYVQDIGEGKGIAQYYTGFGLPQSLAFTPAPVEEVAPVADVIEPVVETGGGGGGIGDVDITTPDVGDAPINVDTPLTQMITTPTGDTMTVKEAFTQDDAYSLDSPPITDQAGAVAAMTQDDAYSLDSPAPNALEQDIAQVAKDTTQAEFDALAPEIGYGVGEVDPKLAEAAGIVDYSDPNIDAMYTDDRIVSEEKALDPFAYTDQIMDPNLMDIRQQQAIDFAPEQQGLIDQAFSKVGSTASDIMNDLSQIPGAVADFANQTVDIAGQKINVGSTLLKAGINKIIGGPISLVLDAIGALGIKGGRGDVSDSLAEKYGRDDIGRLTTGVMAGYSVGPNFAQTIQDRIDNIKNRKAPQTDASRKTIEELETIKAETIAAGSSGVITEPGTVLGSAEFLPEGEDLVTAEELAAEERKEGLEELSDIYSGIGQTRDAPSPTPQEIPDRGRGDGRDTGPSGLGEAGSDAGFGQADQGEAGSDAGFSDTGPDYSGVTTGGPPSRGGSAGGPPSQGGGSSGGGKSIICTAMYQTTGLEDWSKAMKIWYIYQKKYLTIQHQEGYHKLFKPFVKGMHKNSIIKAIGAHVARHRTQDLKHVMFGSKPSWLGRVYRKVLEPICYWVGKHAKR